ncbi:hypothetical protein ACS6GB_23630, partial [Enterobacter hormaechei subsp. xiangfangensis]|uniref:hypothetical protein n=1 Tax=Enterobacter hormaechei TaxID=158836 RepID=UPI003F434EB5
NKLESLPGSYYCGRHVQSFNFLMQKAQGSVVHLNTPAPWKGRDSLFLVAQVLYRLAFYKGL